MKNIAKKVQPLEKLKRVKKSKLKRKKHSLLWGKNQKAVHISIMCINISKDLQAFRAFLNATAAS